MPIHKYFVKENVKKAEIDEFLSNELKSAGYSRVELTKTPLGTRVVIYASKPGMVIGRRGQSIRDLSKILEERFGVENPQISVAPIEVPELDPRIIASQIASALQKGIHFRRAAYWAIQRVMSAGASGVEIVISGKLTTERARYEKYRAGYLPRVGDHVSKQVKTGVAVTQLKPGLYGVKVTIVPPNIKLPDKPEIKQSIIESQSLKEFKEESEKVADTEKT
ncbi:MAG: 30S ribosomal protein S3 [Candidatus Bathyarchaeia archaeon]